MGSTRLDVFIHFTWQTKNRKSILTGELECFVHQDIRSAAEEFGLEPIAVNSAWDHSHILCGWNASAPIGKVVQRWKGRTAYRWNNSIRESRDHPKLRWQEGYGAFSIRRTEVDAVRRYIDRQKEQHRKRDLWWRFERHLWREHRSA